MKARNVVERRIAAWGLLLALLLGQGCSSTPPEPSAESEPPPPAARPADSGAAPSNRRVFPGCDPGQEAKRFRNLLDQDVLITFAWQDKKMKDATANLQVPAKVVRVEPPYVAVDFDRRIPNLELYTSVWLYSGHIHALADGAFGVDPCSAKFEEGGWQSAPATPKRRRPCPLHCRRDRASAGRSTHRLAVDPSRTRTSPSDRSASRGSDQTAPQS